MELKKFKKYETELVNGSKGNIFLHENNNLMDCIENNPFIKDSFTESYIRTSAIIKHEFVGYQEVMVDKENGSILQIKKEVLG